MRPTPRLTQKRFSELLRAAQAVLHVSNAELGDGSGTDATTISRYRSPAYPSGPPAPAKRRILEKVLGVPEGYLDGELGEIDLKQYRTNSRGASRAAERGVHGQAGIFSVELAKIRAEIENYERAKELIAPRLVRVWLDNLEQANAPETRQAEGESGLRRGGTS